jgi:signal transduction histidine kinase
MQFHPFQTLQGRFTLYLSILLIVVISILSYRAISMQQVLLKNAIVREGKALAESLAISCTNTMLYEEIGLVEEGGLLDNYISDLIERRDLDIVYAMILDPKGEVVAHNSLREVGQVYQDEVSLKALASWSTLIQDPSPHLLDISTPLAISTKRWGTLRIGFSLESLRRETASLLFKYILYTSLFILISIATIAILFGFITNPLKLLSREMDRVTTNEDLPSIRVDRRDEIGALQRSFYEMVKRIREGEKERERTQKNLLLTEKMVAIGKLTAGVAHEINNPLGGILNCIYHFKKGGQPIEKQIQYLDLMENGIKRIQKTVVNLLEYARNPNLEKTPTNFSSLIERTLSLLEFQIHKNQINVEQEILATLPEIRVDSDQMGQVLVNTLLNSIQAMPNGGAIKVSLKTADERLILTISDTGQGIPEEILPKVFDPFFTTKGEGQGTGLGLWLSQGIVERHGGMIQLFSQEGKGTTVEIQLPVS